MGLFWSMELEPSVSERHRFTKAGADPDRVRLVAELDGSEVTSTELIRRYLLPTHGGVDVRHGGLVGTLFHRPGERRPALISLTGSGGGEAKEHAALLASHGFTCLSLAYFNAAGLPPALWEIPLEYFQTAIAWLSEQDSVLPGAIGVTGISKGGELSLLLGATFPEIRAVVARVPSSVVWTGIGPGHRRGERSSWSFRGQPLPFVAGNEERLDWTTKPVRVAEFYRAGMEDAAAMDRAAIAVEKINGPIMLLSGTDDALWPSTPFSELVVARLERKGFPHHVEHLRYEGAGHGIYHPHVPSTAIETVHPVTHVWITIGGTPRLNAYACTDSWPRVLAFLHDALD
jgi:dienelactone hydrolase